MKTITKRHHGYLLKQYHTLCSQLDLDVETKLSLLQQYGCNSSKDMSATDLTDLCNKLHVQLNPELEKMDLWRKRVLGAIGGWLKLVNKESTMPHIKAIACRATEYEHFNAIPKQRLINLYSAFTKKQKDFKVVEELTAHELDLLTYQN